MERGWSGRDARLATGFTAFAFAMLAAGVLLLAGCHHDDEGIRAVAGGNAKAGKIAIHAYGCGACHTVPGVSGATGLAGPPLTRFARRSFIAGEASNTADNLVRWIRAPESIEPGTAMPDLGVTEKAARDMAAYLYTLR
jgi:cytochrome c1